MVKGKRRDTDSITRQGWEVIGCLVGRRQPTLASGHEKEGSQAYYSPLPAPLSLLASWEQVRREKCTRETTL